MCRDSDINYLWKDIEYDTPAQIAGKVYPRTIFYIHWLKFFFHIIETENGEYYCGYTDYPDPYREVRKCSKTFVDNLVLTLYQNSIPIEIQKYSNDVGFCDHTHSPVEFWSIECHWESTNFRFIDDCNYFTNDFTVSASRLMKKLTDWISQETNIYPMPCRKNSFGKKLKGLLERYFK